MREPAPYLKDFPIGRLCALLLQHRQSFRNARSPFERERARRLGNEVKQEMERRGLRVAAGRFTDAPEAA